MTALRSPAVAPPATARPRRPIRLARGIASVVIVAAVVIAFWSVDIRWDSLLTLPQAAVHLFGQLFLPPAWAKLSR